MAVCVGEKLFYMQKPFYLLQALDWKLTPLTINTWLRIYLQLCSYKQDEKAASFLTPVFSGKDLVQAAKVCHFFPWEILWNYSSLVWANVLYVLIVS